MINRHQSLPDRRASASTSVLHGDFISRPNLTHFDNLVADGDQVRLLRRPEELVLVSAKTASPTAAPWLRL